MEPLANTYRMTFAVTVLVDKAPMEIERTLRVLLTERLDEVLALASAAKAKRPARQTTGPGLVDACTSRIPWDLWDTVLGHMAKNCHSALTKFDYTDPGAIVGHSYWLTSHCRTAGMEPRKVSAPKCYRHAGIDVVNAYPVFLLRERLGY